MPETGGIPFQIRPAARAAGFCFPKLLRKNGNYLPNGRIVSAIKDENTTKGAKSAKNGGLGRTIIHLIARMIYGMLLPAKESGEWEWQN